MGIFDSTQQKWIKRKVEAPWNLMFTSFRPYDTMITKLIVYQCASFADDLLSTDLFASENPALRAEAIVFAKMHFYHMITKSSTIHNMFYGYIFELWVNHYHEDIETANLVLGQMHNTEKWYLSQYYDDYDSENGSFGPVMETFCRNVKFNKNTDGKCNLVGSTEELQFRAAEYLSKMHIAFLNEIK